MFKKSGTFLYFCSQRCQMFVCKELALQRNEGRHSEGLPQGHRHPVSWWN